MSRHSAATAACKPASSSISILSAQRGAALVNSFSNFRLRASCGPPLLGAAQSTRELFRVESLRKQVYLFFEERGKQSWRVAEALSPAWPAARPGHGPALGRGQPGGHTTAGAGAAFGLGRFEWFGPCAAPDPHPHGSHASRRSAASANQEALTWQRLGGMRPRRLSAAVRLGAGRPTVTFCGGARLAERQLSSPFRS